MSRRFIAEGAGPSTYRFAELCQEHANNLWIPTHLTDDQASAFALDHFRRAVLAELATLAVTCQNVPAT